MDLQALADQNMIAVGRISDTVQRMIAQVWWNLPDWHSPDQFLEQALDIIEGGQIQVGMLTNSYLEATASQIGGTPVVPVTLDTDAVTNLRQGVTMAEAYQRPFHQLWWKQSQGMEFPDALRWGLDRAQAMVSLDIQLARTHATAVVLQEMDGVQRYQRVLSGAENCKLCVTAAKNVYKVSRLMPIHAHCDCTVMPVVDGHPPKANRINAKRDSLTPDEDRKGPVMVEDHGELGPILKLESWDKFNKKDLELAA